MRTIWFALLLSIGGYFVLTLFAHRADNVERNNMLSMILIIVAASTTLMSFLIKSKLLAKAVDGGQVQQAYVMAWAVTEAGALMGVLDYFLTNDRYYYALFLMSACAQLLHFPRSEHVVNASLGTNS